MKSKLDAVCVAVMATLEGLVLDPPWGKNGPYPLYIHRMDNVYHEIILLHKYMSNVTFAVLKNT